MRRNPDQSWHGDMLDGCGLVDAIRSAGCNLQTGGAMFDAVARLMVGFLLAAGALAR